MLEAAPQDMRPWYAIGWLKMNCRAPCMPECVSWLGVTVYPSNDAVMEMLGFVANLAKCSSITFDYRISITLLDPMQRMVAEYLGNVFAAMGEPWRSSFEPVELRQRRAGLGFSSTENFAPTELNTRFFAGRKDGLQFGDEGFLYRCARA